MGRGFQNLQYFRWQNHFIVKKLIQTWSWHHSLWKVMIQRYKKFYLSRSLVGWPSFMIIYLRSTQKIRGPFSHQVISSLITRNTMYSIYLCSCAVNTVANSKEQKSSLKEGLNIFACCCEPLLIHVMGFRKTFSFLSRKLLGPIISSSTAELQMTRV